MKSLKDIIMLYHLISDESYEKLDQIMEVKEYKRKTELSNSNKFFILKKGFVKHLPSSIYFKKKKLII